MKRPTPTHLLTILIAALACWSGGPAARPNPAAAAVTAAGAAPLAIRVQGNHFVDGGGRPLRLLGVDRDGTEYMCVRLHGPGFYDGPVDDAAIGAMTAWNINSVRVPLNEDCWLGVNADNPSLAGAPYQAAIHSLVDRLNQAGLYVILDLHWNAPGSTIAASQQPMADADHGVDFWASVAASFKSYPAVLFDLYNEPITDLATDRGTDHWGCWLNGCTVNVLMGPNNQFTPLHWQTTGMQQLVNAVRGAGARQPILLGGLAYANDLSGWIAHLPQDPAGQLAASFHVYNWNPCRTPACWTATVGAVAQTYPVVTGEFGENDCGSAFVNSYMAWADQAGVSYLAWAWVIYGPDCHSGVINLISAYSGTATVYGQAFRDHLAQISGQPGPPPAVGPGQPGRFHPLPPARLLDTRAATQVGPYGTPFGPAGSRTVQVAGGSGVPARGATSVVLNLTVTGGDQAGYLTLWPAGFGRPTASSINWRAGETRANLVTVQLGPGGDLAAFNSAGSVDVLMDVAGYFSAGAGPDGLFNPLPPARLYDSRGGAGAMQGGDLRAIAVAGLRGVPASGASAVVLNITVTGTSASGYLTVFPAGTTRPTASNLNWAPGQTIPNRVVVGLGGGAVSVFDFAGSADIVVDVSGWFSDGVGTTTGLLFTPVGPLRILDTRSGSQVGPYTAPLPTGQASAIPLAGQQGLPASGLAALEMNATAAGGGVASYVTFYPGGGSGPPAASDLNWDRPDPVANLVVVSLGPAEGLMAYSPAGGCDLILDVTGYFS